MQGSDSGDVAAAVRIRRERRPRRPPRPTRQSIREGASHARQQLPEVEPSATSVTKDSQSTTTVNNFGNTNIREDLSETPAVKHPRGGITRSAATARGGAKHDVGGRGRPGNNDGEQLQQHHPPRGPKRGRGLAQRVRRVQQCSLPEGDDARGRQPR
jgi:hypothetical protein